MDAPHPSGSASSAPTHAGGIVCRLVGGAPHYLLIAPKGGAPEWLLPKGHIEPGETPPEAAVREVREETGVDADVVAPIALSSFTLREVQVRVLFYLLAWRADGTPAEQRTVRWFPYAEAVQVLTHAENRALLERAESLRGTSTRRGIAP